MGDAGHPAGEVEASSFLWLKCRLYLWFVKHMGRFGVLDTQFVASQSQSNEQKGTSMLPQSSSSCPFFFHSCRILAVTRTLRCDADRFRRAAARPRYDSSDIAPMGGDW